MKIASTAVVPPFLEVTPHRNYQLPICPTFKDDPYETAEFGKAPQFGDGTTYPVAARWMANAAQYCRPGRLLLRKESFYRATRRATIHDPELTETFKFGPVSSGLRTSGTNTAEFQYQLSCGMNAAVSQVLEHNSIAGSVDYRITMGYGFSAEIAVNSQLEGQGFPIWSDYVGAATYLNQIGALSAYFVEDVLTRGLTSIIYNDASHRPPESFEKCGKVSYDFTDQFNDLDDPVLKNTFPLYRNAWFEDGHGLGAPAAWFSEDALISLCWIAWDKELDGTVIPDQSMKDELQGLIRM